MTLMLQAPYPDIQTTSILPNPKASDFQNQTHSLDVHRSMNGVKYTYVKSKPDRRLTMNFTLSRMKAAWSFVNSSGPTIGAGFY